MIFFVKRVGVCGPLPATGPIVRAQRRGGVRLTLEVDLSAALSLDAARELADEVLFPSANEVDALPVLPRDRLDLLADRGWYGLSAPSSGFDLVSARPVVEAFAGACLTTTFVWMQHLGTPPGPSGRLVTRWASGRTARWHWASPGGAAG